MKKDTKTLLFENMGKLDPMFKNVEETAMGANGLPLQTTGQPVVQQPSDVKNLGNIAQKASTVNTAAKRIDTSSEFAGSFQNWFNNLGYNPQKISKSRILMDVTKVLNNLGYR